MAERSGRKRSGRKALLIVLSILFLLILGAAAGAAIYANHLLSSMNYISPGSEETIPAGEAHEYLYNDPEVESAAPGETYTDIEDIVFSDEESPAGEESVTGPAAGETGSPQPTSPGHLLPAMSDVYGDHLVNIMLVGQDRREGEGRQRSDAMILVSFNKSRGTITLTSFMRDQYVRIPGYAPNKLNSAYVFGGMRLLAETLELNFGVKLDGIVEVDFGGFEDIVDLLGGVDLYLTQAEADYFNRLGYSVSAGSNHMDGHEALIYSRVRSIDSDYARANRQRKLITALIQSYRNLPLDQMLSIMDSILPMITTNMTNSQIINHVLNLFPMLAGAQINTGRIPLDGTFDAGLVRVREGFTAWFQYNIDFYANKQALWDIFRK